MPYAISIENLPAGYVSRVLPDTNQVEICMTGLLTSDDGGAMTDVLESLVDPIVNLLPAGVTHPRSQVDHFLAILGRDKSARIYLNELPMSICIRAKNRLAPGSIVMDEDIADVLRLKLGDVFVPQDCGIVLLLSAGWHKGLFFDLAPLSPLGADRQFEIEFVAGQVYAQLMFQKLHRITDSTWDELMRQKWFPFRGLSNTLTEQVISLAKNSKSIDDLLPQISAHVRERLAFIAEGLLKELHLRNHASILCKAIERFRENDFVSCVTILFTRIEGVLRELSTAIGANVFCGQGSLAGSVSASSHPRSPLLPRRFEQYLREVYFAKFSPTDVAVSASRNSVAHGRSIGK